MIWSDLWVSGWTVGSTLLKLCTASVPTLNQQTAPSNCLATMSTVPSTPPIMLQYSVPYYALILSSLTLLRIHPNALIHLSVSLYTSHKIVHSQCIAALSVSLHNYWAHCCRFLLFDPTKYRPEWWPTVWVSTLADAAGGCLWGCVLSSSHRLSQSAHH